MQETPVQQATAARSPVAALLVTVFALGLMRAASRMLGLVALGGVVLASVVTLTVGILVLKVLLG